MIPHHPVVPNQAPKDIIDATILGNIDLVKFFLAKGADLMQRDNDGNTIMHWASFKGNIPLVKLFNELQFRLDCVNFSFSQTPLLWACISGNVRIVDLLCKAGASLDVEDSYGYSPLHHAVQNQHVPLVCYLLGKGLPVDRPDKQGHTPLLWAAYNGDVPMIELLMKFGANIHWRGTDGMTALHWSATQMHFSASRLLLSHGVDFGIKDSEGKTAEELAARKGATPIVEQLERARNYPVTRYRDNPYPFLWFILPSMLIPLFTYFFCNFAIYYSIPIIVAIYFLVLKLVKPYWPSGESKNKFFCGFFFGSWLISAYAWFSYIWDLNTWPMFSWFFTILNFSFLYLFYNLNGSNPGWLPVDTVDVKTILPDDENEHIRDFCGTCLAYKPLRAKHCRVCNRCILRMDHHCGWLDNCVGSANHVKFMVLLMIIVSMHVTFVVAISLYLKENPEIPSMFPLGIWLVWMFNNETLLFFMLGFHLLNSFWEGMILYGQINGLLQNKTTNEAMSARRYKYWYDKNGRFINPFDKGIRANLTEFFFDIEKWNNKFTL